MISPKDYSYTLPEELIAKSPADPRDSARLFVYDTSTDTISFSTFSHIADFLPSDSLAVINETKVVPARVFTVKDTGGRVEILLSINTWKGTFEIFGISNKKLKVGDTLSCPKDTGFLKVLNTDGKEYKFELCVPPHELLSYLEIHGHAPLPPYIKNSPLSEAEKRLKYQTVFASDPRSVAAPTASLHFTDKVFSSFKEKNIGLAKVSLHVGLGTFSPVTEENIKSDRLHTELFSIEGESAQKISFAKKHNQPIIAFGTTVVRTLESAKDGIGTGKDVRGETNIFIKKPHSFSLVDILLTNFHVPESSLMMLVDAFLSHKGSSKDVLDLYQIAIQEKFRFFSFGDAMLIK